MIGLLVSNILLFHGLQDFGAAEREKRPSVPAASSTAKPHCQTKDAMKRIPTWVDNDADSIKVRQFCLDVDIIMCDNIMSDYSNDYMRMACFDGAVDDCDGYGIESVDGDYYSVFMVTAVTIITLLVLYSIIR